MNMPGNFSNTILTMKFKVKGRMRIKLKKYSYIRLKQVSNPSASHREKESQLHDIHTMLGCRDKGKNKQRSMTFCTGVKFSKWSDFIENGLKLMRLICDSKKV